MVSRLTDAERESARCDAGLPGCSAIRWAKGNRRPLDGQPLIGHSHRLSKLELVRRFIWLRWEERNLRCTQPVILTKGLGYPVSEAEGVLCIQACPEGHLFIMPSVPPQHPP